MRKTVVFRLEFSLECSTSVILPKMGLTQNVCYACLTRLDGIKSYSTKYTVAGRFAESIKIAQTVKLATPAMRICYVCYNYNLPKVRRSAVQCCPIFVL